MTTRDRMRTPEEALEEVPPAYMPKSLKPDDRHKPGHDGVEQLSDEMARNDFTDGFVFTFRALQ
jgi:hypothetical protein